jgi:hypothetical protein
MQLIKAVQETRAIADVLACFEGTDLVLADDLMFELQQIVAKLELKLPKLEKRWVWGSSSVRCCWACTG